MAAGRSRCPRTTRAAIAAVALLPALAGCGGSGDQGAASTPGVTMPTAAVARTRIEEYIASDIRRHAISAGIGATVTVHSVRCARRDRIHYVCDIRTSSSYGSGVDGSVADAFYDPETEEAGYDIRP